MRLAQDPPLISVLALCTCSYFSLEAYLAPSLNREMMEPNGSTSLSNGTKVGPASGVPSRHFAQLPSPSITDFTTLCSQSVSDDEYPLYSHLASRVPIYAFPDWKSLDPFTVSNLQDEWYHILLSGPGVFVIKEMFDASLLGKTNSVFRAIIDSQKTFAKGDHFSSNPSGESERLWNSFSKHALADPDSFTQYYANPLLALVCEAWLGPAYRITTQVNIVKPGGAAQVSHRDYHLGFQTANNCAAFPKAIQIATQLLTLQGAVAHTNMPLDSGPTRLLPFSQLFEAGYVAYRRPEFNEYFLKNYVSVPLECGDALFFNPALSHAAGENRTTDFSRSANLIQVSSAFGKPMETIDTLPLIECTWDTLLEKYKKEGMSDEVGAFVNALAEGYPFPTNLDRRPPAPGGMAPESEQDILRRALHSQTDLASLVLELRQMRNASKA